MGFPNLTDIRQSFKKWNQEEDTIAYQQLEEEASFLSEKGSAPLNRQRNHARTLNKLYFLTILNILILGASIFINGFRFLPKLSSSSDNNCTPAPEIDINAAIQETSYYSPILKDLQVSLHDIKINGTLWPPQNPSWSRAERSPETDTIWESFEPHDIFPITRSDVISLGKDPETTVKFPPDFPGLPSPHPDGPDGEWYWGSFDMLHKTHCLNELRKMTFEHYHEETPTYTHHGRFWWLHLRHCVDILMQDQLCHADADIITYQWVDTQQYPFSDMSVNRKCRDWDAIRDWGTSRYVDFDEIVKMTKPEGHKTVPFDRGYYEWYGFEGSELFPDGRGFEEYPW
ncbi:MAG: hypothetical protein MMC33_007731 [Icmadophila ericetorum]|nr:hypothetical protein [Icmadophila ericetorum]